MLEFNIPTITPDAINPPALSQSPSGSDVSASPPPTGNTLPSWFEFDKIDTDGNGAITKPEWNSFIDQNQDLTSPQKDILKSSFDLFASTDLIDESGNILDGTGQTITAREFTKNEPQFAAILNPANYNV